MAMTLVESAKLLANQGNDLAAGVALKFAETSGVLDSISFASVNGNAYSYNVEETMPGIAFRGVNESFTESTGVINPQSEALKILGGDMDVDTFIINTEGQSSRAAHIDLKLRAAALYWTKQFFKGDATSDPRGFDGLQTRLTGGRVIENHATGAGLSLAKLRRAISNTVNPTHIYMGRDLYDRFEDAAMNTSVGGFVQFTPGNFGAQVPTFRGIPIISIDRDELDADILGFTETGTTTSVYVVSHTPMGVIGLENGMINARDLGEIDTSPVYRTRVEWYNAIAVKGARAATRLKNITDVAVTA